MASRTLTPREVQDFENGYSEAYRAARHGEASLEGSYPSPAYADGVRRGLADGRAKVFAPGRSARDLEAARADFVGSVARPSMPPGTRRG